MKIPAVIFAVFLLSGSVLQAAPEKQDSAAAQELPQIAIMDVISSSLDKPKARMITDIISSEIFKLRLFRIVDRSVIERIVQERKISLGSETGLLEVGRQLAVQKLFICSIEKIDESTAINIKIIDVGTTLIDYTENIFINDKSDNIFEAVRECVKKVELFYIMKEEEQQTGFQGDASKRKWGFLGATDQEVQTLSQLGISPNDYLDLRQFDISFTIADYIAAVQNGWNAADIKKFLIAGIRFPLIKKAFTLGITDLEKYQTTFAPDGFNFEEYLEAYQNKIMTVEEYRNYREGYRNDRFVLGAGGVANSLPIANSDFGFFLFQLGWEHFWSDFQRGRFKWSTQAGAFLMDAIIPAPYISVNFYLGHFPFYVYAGAGGHAELLLGGHVAGSLSLGLEIKERVFMHFNIVPFGTDPAVSYTDLKTKKGQHGYVRINYPYYVFTVGYKF